MRPRSSGRAGKGNPTSPPTAHRPLPPPAVPAGTPEPAGAPEPAGNPLSGSLERREAGIRASPRPRRRRTRPGEKGAEAQRGAQPCLSGATRGAAPSLLRPLLALARRGEAGHWPSLRLPRALSAGGCLSRGPCSCPKNHYGPSFFLANLVISPQALGRGSRVSLRMTSKMPLCPTPSLSTLKSPV